ncbi:nascent polypeptide-associated complex protein [archaeon]|nr:nascent polypeptide-associated complex protein [archaeon]|tara:strand:- start:216 stop:548 length:333 start_codon:yes stop_codon:yes gene_type:complete
MIPGMNPKMLKQAMKRMGIKQQELDAKEVIIKTEDKEIIVRNPQVLKVNMGGQETLQISGQLEERKLKEFTEEDVDTVAEQANVTKEKAREALEKKGGDLAAAILLLKAD